MPHAIAEWVEAAVAVSHKFTLEEQPCYCLLNYGSLDAQTREGATKLELCREMNDVAARMGSLFSVDLTNLAQASSRWDGIVYTGHLPDDVQRAILQEIFDISFKQEFLLLDRFLYILMPQQEDGELENKYDASTHEDRNLIIKDALFSNGPPAFGHSDSCLRQAALHLFF
ncbi:hypothetical protein BDP27DRAFT_1431469 [Rhodocollybia butyracea]|uniref:Uncharacterized protein n=1 Tax=Rhodocollybia butyracea TaxID=206335 RepID=A0A9P5TXE1_9AGAR|nr:hypothetical protein BDP27DRAFT_1431469 [Rhodocollybia butyracea]